MFLFSRPLKMIYIRHNLLDPALKRLFVNSSGFMTRLRHILLGLFDTSLRRQLSNYNPKREVSILDDSFSLYPPMLYLTVRTICLESV